MPLLMDSEARLEQHCNLIKSGTHQVVRPFHDPRVYVIDIKKPVDFFAEDAEKRAVEIAWSSFDSMDGGCANCPIYGDCFPTPATVYIPEHRVLHPALLTSLD